MGKINLVVILTDMELHENAFQNELKLKNLNSIVAHRDVNSISYYYIFEWEYIPPKTLTDFSSYIFRVL